MRVSPKIRALTSPIPKCPCLSVLKLYKAVFNNRHQGGLLRRHPPVRGGRHGKLAEGKLPQAVQKKKNSTAQDPFCRPAQVTHGCIIATLKLFLPDGKEAKASPTIMSGVVGGVGGGGGHLPPQDLYLLNQYIQVPSPRNMLTLAKYHRLNSPVFFMNFRRRWPASSCWRPSCPSFNGW